MGWLEDRRIDRQDREDAERQRAIERGWKANARVMLLTDDLGHDGQWHISRNGRGVPSICGRGFELNVPLPHRREAEMRIDTQETNEIIGIFRLTREDVEARYLPKADEFDGSFMEKVLICPFCERHWLMRNSGLEAMSPWDHENIIFLGDTKDRAFRSREGKNYDNNS